MNDLKDTIELINEGDQFVQYRDELVLVIGNSGSGKSATVQYIAGDLSKLESRKVDGKMIIVGTDGHIHSSPNFPSLFSYKGQNFYDCPGFGDKRDRPHSVAAAYFMKKVLDKAKKVKLVLVADYSSIMGPDNSEFMRLLEQASSLVKDLSECSYSTFLVATRLREYDIDSVTKKETIRPTDTIVWGISAKLSSMRDGLNTGNSNFKGTKEQLSNVVKFLSELSLGRPRNGIPPRIFLFRQSTAEGPLDKQDFLVGEKVRIEYGISNTPYWTPSGSFGLCNSKSINQLVEGSVAHITGEITKLKDVLFLKPDLQTVYILRQLEELRSSFETKIEVFEKSDPKMNEAQMVDDLLGLLNDGLVELGIESTSMNDAKNYSNLLQYLKLFKTDNISPVDLMKRIVESLIGRTFANDWIRFLLYLYTELSSYSIQINRHLYNVKDISFWGKGGSEEEIFITADNVSQFIDKVRETIFKNELGLPKPENIRDSKLNELNEVLRLTLKQKVVLKSMDGVISLKQNIICLKEVALALKDQKHDKMSLKLFATDKIFINDSMNLPSWNVTLIAPFIQVNQNQIISLKGTDVSDFVSGAATSVDGSNGESAKDGGNFLSITISSLEGLRVDVSGGRGQNGQKGGEGTIGEDGTDAPVVEGYYPPGIEGKEWKTTKTGDYKSGEYLVYAPKKGYRGGNGAKGGDGGKGGNSGIIFTTSRSITKTSVPGSGGSCGYGGNGGLGGKHGRDRIFKRIVEWHLFPFIRREDGGSVVMNPERADSGSRGVNGASGPNGLENTDKSEMVSDLTNYKLYSLEMEENPFFLRSLTAFRDQVLQTNSMDSLYNSLALYNEMISFDKEYRRLRRAPNIISQYRDLLMRVERYSSKIQQDEELNTENSKRSLQVLYTAVLGKICSLERGLQRTLVVDIRQFIETAISQVKIFKKQMYTETLKAEKEKFGQVIKKRIVEANILIKSQVVQGIDDLIERARVEISNLTKEVASLESDKTKQKKAVEKLEEQFKLVAALSIVKNLAKIIDLSGSYGEAVNGVIQGAVSIGESFNKIDREPLNVSELPTGVVALKKVSDDAKESANKRIDSLEHLLQDMQDAIDQNSSKSAISYYTVLPADRENNFFSETKSKIGNLLALVRSARDKLNKEPSEEGAGIELSEVESTLNQAEDQIKQVAKRENGDNGQESSDSKDKKEDKKTKEEDALEKEEKEMYETFGKLVKGFGFLKDAYKGYASAKEDIEIAHKASENLYEQLVELDQYGRQVREVMAPMIEDMGKDLKRVSKTLSEKSQVVLDITKWKVQSKMREFKRMLEKSTSGFKAQEEFKSIIAEISEAMTTMIGLYDRIENYKQQAELADHIANMNDRGFGIDKLDGELGDSVREMRLIIQTNIVLDRFEACVEAVKQWVFPFAINFLGSFKLPDQLESGQNQQTLVEDVVGKIDALKSHINDYYSSMQPQHTFIRHGVFETDTTPFFSWSRDNHAKSISNLLSGEKVLLNADAALGSSFKAAVKFNKIRLNFKLDDKQDQDLLYSHLNSFNLQLTHMGNSYYRFKNKIYVIESNQIPIIYSISKDGKEPVDPNDILTMLINGDILLSPYAMWSVQLSKNLDRSEADFEKLRSFAGKVDLELVGEGKYLDESIGDLSNLDLDNFYRVDRVL